jgi:hypothetical protein
MMTLLEDRIEGLYLVTVQSTLRWKESTGCKRGQVAVEAELRGRFAQGERFLITWHGFQQRLLT